MKNQYLQDQRVEVWKTENPREWLAFQRLKDKDPLIERVLAAIFSGRKKAPAMAELTRFADAFIAFKEALDAQEFEPPPALRESRSFWVTILRMARMQRAGSPFFRVDFVSSQGWGGHFDTTDPAIVEKISKLRPPPKPTHIVGEVLQRPYKFYVELGGHIRIL